MEYTRLTNLEVTGHLKVAGQEVTPGGGSSTLSGLTDVDISNPTDGQTLVYNASTGKWENGAGGGGGASVLVVTDTAGTLDKTWNEINAARQVGVVVLNGLKNQSGYDCPKYLSVISSADGYYFAEFTSLGAGWTTSSYAAESASGTMVTDD